MHICQLLRIPGLKRTSWTIFRKEATAIHVLVLHRHICRLTNEYLTKDGKKDICKFVQDSENVACAF